MASIKRIIQIGSNFRRVSAVMKIQTGGSLGYYSQKSNGLHDFRPEKPPYDIENEIHLANSRQIWEDTMKEHIRQTERIRADLEATKKNLTILDTGIVVAVIVFGCFAVITEFKLARSRKPPNVAEFQGPASDEKK